MRTVIHVMGWVVALLITSAVWADSPALLELRVDKTVYRGKLVARSKNIAWLMDRSGRLSSVQLDSIDSYRRISPHFRGYTSTDVRIQLLREFGKDYEVSGTRRYLVCATKGQSRKYARIFEHVYRSFYRYFATRGFKISEPEFPLVALVFPDRERFAKYCEKDDVTGAPGLMGYYLRTSNRIAVFESPRQRVSSNTYRQFTHNVQMPGLFVFAPDGTIEGSLQETIIHEATHQIAFNIGLHSRIGENPRWVVEGLATVFEAPGIRDTSQRRSVNKRINRERFLWFSNFAKSRRKPKSLAAFIGSDDMFKSATLDAYSQAWALTFYLIETRRRQYAQYLKAIAARDPLSSYSSKERIDDFKKAFGKNWDLLEAAFLRHLKRLK